MIVHVYHYGTFDIFAEEVVLTKNWLRGERLIMFAAGMTMVTTVTFAVSGFSYTRYRSKSSSSMRKRKRKRKGDYANEDCDTNKLIHTVSEEVEMPMGISDSATMLAYNEVLVHPSPPSHTKLHQVTCHPDNHNVGGAIGRATGTKSFSRNPTNFSDRKYKTVYGAEGGCDVPSEDKCIVYSDRKYLTLNVSQLTNSNAGGEDLDETNSDSPSLSFF